MISLDEAAVSRRNGSLHLAFKKAPDNRTFISHQYASYPFHVCRPFYLDKAALAGMATVYTQSCAGGLYTGDQLACTIEAGENCHVHLTSQASTIVHRAEHGPAVQDVRINAAAGSFVEYMPDPMILLPQSQLHSTIHAKVHDTATVVLLDSFLPHDHLANGGIFDQYSNELIIQTQTGIPQVIDRFTIAGVDFHAGNVGLMDKYSCHATVIVYSPTTSAQNLIDSSREVIDKTADTVAGVSELPGGGGIMIRLLANDGVGLKAAAQEIWNAIRLTLTGQTPVWRRK